MGLAFPGPGCDVFLFLGGADLRQGGSGMERMFHVGSAINSWLMTYTPHGANPGSSTVEWSDMLTSFRIRRLVGAGP